MIGQVISHYKILAKIGEGGMGVVYKAEDTLLKRMVALKFLSPALITDPEAKERFIQEAQAASALEHPNICTIHEINETEDGQLYMVMACYEGQTLKDRLANGTMAIEEAVHIAMQIAEGLAEAQEKGIVHRDIKPANIMITEKGEVKIMDFGLAKLAGHILHNKTGSTFGTVAYMSPEQAQGLAVDHRTDIWSLGVILYEMLTGQLPFDGEFDQAILYHIVNQEPEPLENLRVDLPMGLADTVDRALTKQTSDRYQLADDLLTDLRQLLNKGVDGPAIDKTTVQIKIRKKRRMVALAASLVTLLAVCGIFFLHPQTPSERVTLAVADFDNKTKEAELDGLSDLLITALEQSRQIEVLTRTRMFDILRQMKQDSISHINETTARNICKYAHVNALSIATLRKLGKLYTIDLKILDVPNDRYLYTNKEQGEGQESILAMIDKIAARMRKCLKESEMQIQANSATVANILTANFEAHSHYFQGLALVDKRQWPSAAKEFIKAVTIDSTFGLAYLWLVYSDLEGFDLLKSKYLHKALTLMERIPEKERYFLRALQAKQEQGLEAGLAAFRQMEQLYPNEREMLYKMGYWNCYLGHFSLAEDYFNKVLALDPTNRRALNRLTLVYYESGQHKKEYEAAKHFASLDGSDLSYYALARAAALSGRAEQGIALLNKVRELDPGRTDITAYIAGIHSYLGHFDKAESELKRLIGVSQSPQSKLLGYAALLFDYYPYVGKYSEALQTINRYRDLQKQINKNDTTDYSQLTWMERNTYLMAARKINSDSKELEKKERRDLNPTALNNKIIAVMPTFLGDYDTDRLDSYDIKEPMAKCIRSLIQMQQNCDQAESYADTLLYTWEPLNYLAFIYYQLAVCLYQNEKFEKALYYLAKLQKRWNIYGVRSIFYPKSILLQAKIYEKMNERSRALQKYHQFLRLWKDADPDLPDLIEAKTNFARLDSGV